jgi:hypothetical protein
MVTGAEQGEARGGESVGAQRGERLIQFIVGLRQDKDG